jgi:hypothetical protein
LDLKEINPAGTNTLKEVYWKFCCLRVIYIDVAGSYGKRARAWKLAPAPVHPHESGCCGLCR